MTEYSSIGKIIFYFIVCYNFSVCKYIVCEPLLALFPQALQIIIMTPVESFGNCIKIFQKFLKCDEILRSLSIESIWFLLPCIFSVLEQGQAFSLFCFPLLASYLAPQPWGSKTENI